MKSYKSVMLKPADNVAVALEEIPQGEDVLVVCQEFCTSVNMAQMIEFGHKFAVRPIKNGEDILKYGEVIGAAITDIRVGEHVHVHNIEGKRGRGDQLVANE